ncbi:Dcp2, box A domain-containing protein [Gymnopilus junonius]|uniref:Dcp2, box A domain-containing protein n=1 Tax=Gymnopilus junonius TaxID=109634 RepID=A0A9P5NVJ8_GYMJU|nr:Dcp2, box A domain-containing protein [Gymnopilus junonius]
MASSSSSSPEIPAATCTDPLPRFSYKDASQDEVLEDLSSRFILNLPDEELASLERLCFQVEQAHWFYEDFIREENTKLPSLPLKKFSEMLFHACPLLQQWSDDHEQAFNNFMQYKTRVPVCGAIMLNDAMDKCVLVKGWKASAGWGFPKGKINEVEPPPTCAIREVLEETGYNLAGQLIQEDVIELSIKEQKISLFIVPGVPEDFAFKTKTRKEISKIEWFRLTDLPTWKKNKAAPGRFYLIAPFMGRLKAWINDHKRPNNTARKNAKQRKTQHAPSMDHPRNGGVTHDSDRIQESISKSSSFEDLGPQTPSPQQPEPTMNSTLADVEMDPQLARLLSSLTLSAATQDKVNEKSNIGPVHNPQQFDSTSSSESSADSPITSHAHEQPDWSSSAPPHLSLATGLASQSSPSHASFAGPSHLSITGKASLSSLVNGNANQSSHSLSHSVYDTTSSPLHPPTSPTSRRKSSSTADISPYLARNKEVPTSGKLLQQLSLLEAVADESAKMAPIIAARAAMASRGPASNGYHLQPPSFLPQPLPASDMETPYAYPSLVPSSATGFHPRYPPENTINGYQDPFQVRPRTSQAFQRSALHNHNPTGSVNINYNHFPPNTNGVAGVPLGPDFQMASQFVHQQRVQMSNANPSHYGATNPAQYRPAPLPQFPMHGYNSFFSNPVSPSVAGMRSYSTVNPINPNAMPGINNVPNNGPNQNSLALLSILNSRANQ